MFISCSDSEIMQLKIVLLIAICVVGLSLGEVDLETFRNKTILSCIISESEQDIKIRKKIRSPKF